MSEAAEHFDIHIQELLFLHLRPTSNIIEYWDIIDLSDRTNKQSHGTQNRYSHSFFSPDIMRLESLSWRGTQSSR
jgi:hypothetical protein